MAALSLATDLGIGVPLEHGLQSTLVAMRLAEPHCHQRALQTVLERHPDPEVRRQRQRRDHLSGTDPFPTRRCHVCHPLDSTRVPGSGASARMCQPNRYVFV